MLAVSLVVLAVQVSGWSQTVRPMLDPGKLYWWRSHWAPAPVTLSSNNAQATNVVATFYFSPTTAVSEGVLEVTFPAGFSVTGSGAVAQVSAQSYRPDEDYQVSISGITNPQTAGAYGPFSLRTRRSASGQQVDVNLLFASVYIEAQPHTFSSLQVLFSGANTNNIVNKGGNTLSFKLRLSVSLWRYDTFTIRTSEYWTVGSSPVCVASQDPGKVNNYNGTNSASPHTLSCVSTPKSARQPQTVYIYGLATDGIDVVDESDSQYVTMQVTPLLTPAVAYFPAMFQWTVSTVRFGTNTVLETGTVTNGPTVAPDIITEAEWKPTWGMNIRDLQHDMHLYMDLRFTLPSAVPSGGSASLVITEDVCSLFWGQGDDLVDLPTISCFVLDFLGEKVACSTSAKSTITISNLPTLQSNSAIRIRNLVKIVSAPGAKAQILSVNSYDDLGINIDTGSNLASFTVSQGTASKLASGFDVYFQDVSGANTGLNKAGGTGDLSTYLVFQLVPETVGTALVSSSRVTVKCPLSNSPSDFSIYLPKGTVVTRWKLNSRDFSTAKAFSTIGSPNGAMESIAEGTPGVVSWFAGSNMIPHSSLYFALLTPAGLPLSPPLVASNAATAYECSLRIEDLVGLSPQTTQVSVLQFTVKPQTWAHATDFSMMCSNNVSGAPARVSFLPAVVDMQASTSNKTYMLEVAFTIGIASGSTASALASGLANNDPYPHDCSICSSTTATLTFTQFRNYLRFQGLGKVSVTAAPVTVYFPLAGVVVGTNLQVTIRSFYLLNYDPRVRFVTHEQAPTPYITTATSSVKFTSVSASGNSAITGETVPDPGLTITVQQSSVKASTQWIYMVMPKGYKWTSGKKVVVNTPTAGSEFREKYFFSSPNERFLYPGVLVLASTTSAYISSTSASTLTILGYQLPKGKPFSRVSMSLVAGASDGLVTSACAHTSLTDIAMTATPGPIVAEGVSPAVVASRGPDGVDVTHTVNVRLAHGLDANGFIMLTIDSNWATTACTTCSAVGVTPLSGNSAVTCTHTGNVITVSQFADFSTTRNKMVSITVQHLLAPDTPSAVPYNFIANVVTRTALANGYLVVDQYTPGFNSGVVVTQSSPVGVPQWEAKELFPNASGLRRTAVYIRFRLPHALPACGTLRVAAEQEAWAMVGDLKDRCFLAPVEYSSCAVSGSELLITLSKSAPAGTVYDLFVESAVDSKLASDRSSKAFIVSSYWFTELIDADSTNISSLQLISAQYQVDPLHFTSPSLTVAPATIGEVSTYTFKFSDPVSFAARHQYWVIFPKEYDYYIGLAAQTFRLDPVFYLPCESPQFPMLTCTANHNVLIITSSSVYSAAGAITIVVQNIINPYVLRSGYLQLAHVNDKGECLAITQEFAYVELTSLPMKIDIRSIESSNSVREQVANTTVRLYITGTLTQTSTLRLSFPAEFDLSASTYLCESYYFNHSKPVSARPKESLTPLGNCTVSSNSISLPSIYSSTSLTQQQIVYWSIYNITNPGSGWGRVELKTGSDFDVWDTNVWPVRDFWSSKFSVSLSTRQGTASRSYAQLHSAYLGFTSLYRQLFLDPASSDPIPLAAGTQSADLSITTGSAQSPCEAKLLVLSPSISPLTPDAGGLSFSSKVDKFTVIQGLWRMRFRVAAASTMKQGVYKVVWNLTETTQSGVDEPQYETPEPLFIAVYPAAHSPVNITVAAVPQLTPGIRSTPIRILLAQAPHTDISVNVYILGAPRNISVQPAALPFHADETEAYFQISVSQRYNKCKPLSTETLVFSVSGTDAAAFWINSRVNFTILAGMEAKQGEILSLGLSSINRTSVASRPTVSAPGVLYWWLGAANTPTPSFPELQQAVPSLLQSAPKPPEVIASSALERNETEPGYRESWVNFQKRLYRTHLSSQWKGAIAVTNTSESGLVEFTWLWADTGYTLAMYLQPMLQGNYTISSLSVSFTTRKCAPPQPFRVKFQGTLISAFTSKIGNLAAKYQGVTPLRLFNGTQSLTLARGLQADYYTSFVYSLLPSRYSESPDPETQSLIIGESLRNFEKDLSEKLGIVNVLVSVSNDPLWNRKKVEWTVEPQAAGATNNTVTVRLRASQPGSTCCTVLSNSSVVPSPEQLFLGLSAANEPSPYSCIATNVTNATNTIKVSGLSADTEYFAHCLATDDYPLWATLMDSTLVRSVSVRTLVYNVTKVGNFTAGAAVAVLAAVWLVW